MFKRKVSQSFLVALISISLLGCEPRGETHTVSQVLQDAQGKFESLVGTKASAQLKQDLSQVDALLKSFSSQTASSSSISENASLLAQKLSALTDQMGYTSRPAATELIAQLQNLAAQQVSAENMAQLRSTLELLSARVYSLLSSELEGVGFALGEREMKQ